jgi:ABC-type transport system substrate-binding protein
MSKRGFKIARRALLPVSVMLAGSMVLSACSGSGGDSSSGEQNLSFGLSADPEQPITGMSQGTAVNGLLTLLHRGLMKFDNKGEVQPALAESVETPDDTTYIFKLRSDLKFSDDSELTAENVKKNLDYYRSKDANTSLKEPLSVVKSVEAKDDTTVEVKLSHPNTAFLQYLALPYAAIVPDDSLDPDTANWKGAGPFEMEDMDQGVGMTLKKNDDYYDSKDVKLNEIDVKFYEDGEARSNALLSGDVDIIDYVTWENFDRVEDAGMELSSAKNGPFQYVQFNVEDTPFADPKVRQAVAYALNRDNSVKAAFQNHGKPLAGLSVAKNDPAYSDKLGKLWDYDPEKAKKLLAEAGYEDGFKVNLLSTSQYTFLQDNALSVQDDLKAIGIDAKLDSPDWSTRIQKDKEGDYDLAVSGDSGIVPDAGYLLNWVVDSRQYNNSWGYKSDEIRGLIEKGLQATEDSEKKEIYEQVAEKWKEDVPFATLNTRDQAYAYSDNVKGFKTLPGTLSFYSGYNFEDISVD